MEPRGTWKIRRLAEEELPGDPGPESDPTTISDPIQEEESPLDIVAIAPDIGRIAYFNSLNRDWQQQMTKANRNVDMPKVRQAVVTIAKIPLNTNDVLTMMLKELNIVGPAGDNPKAALFPETIDNVFNQFKTKYKSPSGDAEADATMSANVDKALAEARMHASGQGADGANIKNVFNSQMTNAQKPLMGGKAAWSLSKKKTAQDVNPLSTQPFQSLNDLKAKIIEMGRPQQEGESSQDSIKRVYEKVFDMVGPEHEDRAKAALKSLYQFGIVCELWSLFQEIGLAAPIDQEVIGEIMQNNPDLFNQEKETAKAAGLFLPDPNTGLYTMPEAGLTKTASGGVGGAGAGYPAYEYEGSNRMCPKIRGVVNTFICRYHCLDGLKVDDAQVLCGEALWRQAVMDKFSREYKNEDGEWVGGYLNKRFEIHRDDGGHPYQLKPGRRSAPIHEDAWNYEKRLQEMRKAEGAKRGYGPVSGERDDLYNFDQHKLLGGPESSTLDAKERDSIAKNASTNNRMPRVAGMGMRSATAVQMALELSRIPGPRQEYFKGVYKLLAEGTYDNSEQVLNVLKDLKEAWENKSGKNMGKDHPNIGRDSREGQDPSFMIGSKNETDINELKLEGLASSAKWSLKTAKKSKLDKKASFNLRRLAAAPNDAMGDYTDMGDKAKECVVCKKKFAMEYMDNCDNVQTDAMGNSKRCGGQLRTLDDGTIKGMTGAIDGSDIPIHASSDIEVRYAAGVFVASRMGQRAYGESPSQAVEKLAFKPSPGLAPGQPKTQDPGVNVEELGDELRKEPEGQGEEIQGQEQVQAPMTTVDTTPTTDEVPMSKAPKDPFTDPAAPPPPAAEIEASAVSGPKLAEGETPAETKKAEQELDDLYFGVAGI